MSNIPQNVKNQVIDLINQSGIKPEELIHELSSVYKVKTTEDTIVDYKAYYDSFID